MTITKRIRSKKTPQGYRIEIWVKDADVYKDLLVGIDRFFEKLEQQEKEQEGEQQQLCVLQYTVQQQQQQQQQTTENDIHVGLCNTPLTHHRSMQGISF